MELELRISDSELVKILPDGYEIRDFFSGGMQDTRQWLVFDALFRSEDIDSHIVQNIGMRDDRELLDRLKTLMVRMHSAAIINDVYEMRMIARSESITDFDISVAYESKWNPFLVD